MTLLSDARLQAAAGQTEAKEEVAAGLCGAPTHCQECLGAQTQTLKDPSMWRELLSKCYPATAKGHFTQFSSTYNKVPET